MQKRKGKTEKKSLLGFLTDWQVVRQKPIRFAIVTTVGFWVLFICVPAIFITELDRIFLLGGGLLYCAILSFMSVGLCQFDFLYRFSQWAKKHTKTRIIIAVGLLLLGGLFYLAFKIWPEFIVRTFLWLAVPMKVILGIVLLVIVVASISGWVKYVLRVKRRLKAYKTKR